MDMVFKALADSGRRLLLDRLRQDNGQTLGSVRDLEMARQSVSQHLAVLESANLITSVRRGRLKLHYLNLFRCTRLRIAGSRSSNIHVFTRYGR